MKNSFSGICESVSSFRYQAISLIVTGAIIWGALVLADRHGDTEKIILDEEFFSFAVIGDTQRFDPTDEQGALQTALRSIGKMQPQFVLAVGDLVSSCDEENCAEKLSEWKEAMGKLADKTYAAQGNHDRSGEEESDRAWRNVFSLPLNGPVGFEELAYSFDAGNAHFVALASDSPREHVVNEVQRKWLESDLSGSDKEYEFVFFHEPAYPVSSKMGSSLDDKEEERDALWDILVKYDVEAVFNGHEHIFSRRRISGVYQFVFGNTDAYDHRLPEDGVAEFAYQGKGFGIVRIGSGEIAIDTYTVEGELIDSFLLTARK